MSFPGDRYQELRDNVHRLDAAQVDDLLRSLRAVNDPIASSSASPSILDGICLGPQRRVERPEARTVSKMKEAVVVACIQSALKEAETSEPNISPPTTCRSIGPISTNIGPESRHEEPLAAGSGESSAQGARPSPAVPSATFGPSTSSHKRPGPVDGQRSQKRSQTTRSRNFIRQAPKPSRGIHFVFGNSLLRQCQTALDSWINPNGSIAPSVGSVIAFDAVRSTVHPDSDEKSMYNHIREIIQSILLLLVKHRPLWNLGKSAKGRRYDHVANNLGKDTGCGDFLGQCHFNGIPNPHPVVWEIKKHISMILERAVGFSACTREDDGPVLYLDDNEKPRVWWPRIAFTTLRGQGDREFWEELMKQVLTQMDNHVSAVDVVSTWDTYVTFFRVAPGRILVSDVVCRSQDVQDDIGPTDYVSAAWHPIKLLLALLLRDPGGAREDGLDKRGWHRSPEETVWKDGSRVGGPEPDADHVPGPGEGQVGLEDAGGGSGQGEGSPVADSIEAMMADSSASGSSVTLKTPFTRSYFSSDLDIAFPEWIKSHGPLHPPGPTWNRYSWKELHIGKRSLSLSKDLLPRFPSIVRTPPTTTYRNSAEGRMQRKRFSAAPSCIGLSSYIASGRLADAYKSTLWVYQLGGESRAYDTVTKVVDIASFRDQRDISSPYDYTQEEASSAVTNEIKMYEGILHPLQGSIVPRLLGCWEATRTDLGGLQVIVMCFEAAGSGFESEEQLKQLPPAIKTKIVLVYQKLHALGVKHNDVKPWHVVYNEHTARVSLIDFDCSFTDAPESELAGEMDEVRSMIGY